MTCHRQIWRRHSPCLALCLPLSLCLALAHTTNAAERSDAPNCGVTSLQALADSLGKPLATATVQQLVSRYPAASVSMADVKTMAEMAGIDLIGVKATLDELLARQEPAIIHLRQPAHFELMMDGNDETIRVMPVAGGLQVIARKEVESRFTGYALIRPGESSAHQPHVVFEGVDYSFGVSGVGQEVHHAFRFHNVGGSPLVVSVSGST